MMGNACALTANKIWCIVSAKTLRDVMVSLCKMSIMTKFLAHTVGPSAISTSTTKQTAQGLFLMLAVITFWINPNRVYLLTSCSQKAFWNASSEEVLHHQVWQIRMNPKTPVVKDAALSKPQTQLVSFGTFPLSPSHIGTNLAKLMIRAWQSHRAPRTSATDGSLLVNALCSAARARQRAMVQ